MVINELTKAGIKRDIAIDLYYRYYRNELTYKDIEFLKENFDIKLEKVEALLQAEIKSVKTELDNKIDSKFNGLDTKIDVNKMELKSTLRLHNWMFGTIITLNIGIFLTLIFK
ncbi:Bdr family repetitive protein [Borrelia hermsii]|nr:Bdr family repetitive protein [Borrelia hermsii]ANA44021.1 Bdr protein [Borrelia hermsii HS1]